LGESKSAPVSPILLTWLKLVFDGVLSAAGTGATFWWLWPEAA